MRSGTQGRLGLGGRSQYRKNGGVLLTGMFPMISYRIQNHQPRDDTILSGLGTKGKIEIFEYAATGVLLVALGEARIGHWRRCSLTNMESPRLKGSWREIGTWHHEGSPGKAIGESAA